MPQADAGGTTVTQVDQALSPPPTTPETGPYATLVNVVSVPGAVVALFPDGRAFFSPDGFNLTGGGGTVQAYSGNVRIRQIAPVGGGLEVLFEDGTAYFSPDGNNLGGGGSTVSAYQGSEKIAAIFAVDNGIDAVFSNSVGTYFSPDGLNLGGGGGTVHIHDGVVPVKQIVPVGPGAAVVTLFDDGTTFFSPDNRNLHGGGATVHAAPNAKQGIDLLVRVGGGLVAQFAGGQMYLSPDGKNLAGGGSTIGLTSWEVVGGKASFGARDSAHGAKFAGKLWLSGGFRGPAGTTDCGNDCSYFDLWSSLDTTGAQWNTTANFATASTPNPRDLALAPADFWDAYSALVDWNGRLFAIGHTIWSSPDGINWQRQNAADGKTAVLGPLAHQATENSRAIAMGAYLYLIQPDSGQVFRSADPAAAQWESLGLIQGFPLRCGSMAFALHGQLWIEGGGACNYSQVFNDIWTSSDGITWTQVSKPAEWPGRMWSCAAVDTASDVVWIVGGYSPKDWTNTGAVAPRYAVNMAEVWYSRSGDVWRQYKPDVKSGLTDDGDFEPRHAATCYIDDSRNPKRLVVTAGKGAADPNNDKAGPLNNVRTLPLPAASTLF